MFISRCDPQKIKKIDNDRKREMLYEWWIAYQYFMRYFILSIS